MFVRTVLGYPNKLYYFVRLNWNFFWGFHISWATKWLITYLSVILWSCVHFVCVTLNESLCLFLITFQSAPNLVKILLSVMHLLVFFRSFKLYVFYCVFWFMWDLANFLKWNSIHVKNQFLWWLRGYWTILRQFQYTMVSPKKYIFRAVWLFRLLYGFVIF